MAFKTWVSTAVAALRRAGHEDHTAGSTTPAKKPVNR